MKWRLHRRGRIAILPAVAASALVAPVASFACAEMARDVSPPEEDASTATVLPAAAPSDAGPMDADASIEQCREGAFCYVPLPVSEPLLRVSASSTNDVWAITASTILRWDGTSWQSAYSYNQPGGTTASHALAGIWATREDDVWVIANTRPPPANATARIIRYSKQDGGAPSFREVPFIGPVFSTSATDPSNFYWVTPNSDALWVFSSGSGPYRALLRFREALGGRMTMENMSPPAGEPGSRYTWSSIWGFGPNDVYVGGVMCPLVIGDCSTAASMSSDPEAGFGAIAHYDGTGWSITSLAQSERVLAMFGTRTLDRPRHLWLWVGPQNTSVANATPWRSSLRLVPIADDGSIGAPLVSKSREIVPPYGTCDERIIGSAVSPNAAWFSNGCLVYRWDGTKLEMTPTSIDGRLPEGRVADIWAASAEDAWIVGQRIPAALDSGTGFAARRTKGAAQEGAQP